MTWSSYLKNDSPVTSRVALLKSRSSDESHIVERYQWIAFDLRLNFFAARPTTIVWFWLSCCAGYSGQENPRFWKRVFCELSREPEGAARIADLPLQPDTSVTDAVRFFDQPGHEFPCIAWHKGDLAVCKLFLGLEQVQPVDPDQQPERRLHSLSVADHMRRAGSFDDALHAIYEKLRPFILPRRLERPILVDVHESQLQELQGCAPLMTSSRVRYPQFKPVAESSARTNQRMRLQDLPSGPSVDATAQLDARSVALRSLVSSRHHETGTLYTSLEWVRDEAQLRLLSSVCSALPYAPSIQSVSFKIPGPVPVWRGFYPTWEPAVFSAFTSLDWAWLGYWLFHPDTEQTSLRSLEIDLHGVTPDAVRVLQLMADGNNILNIEAGQAKSQHYHFARVREGSRVCSAASDDAGVLGVLHSLPWVCLCVTDTSGLEEWVQAVAPGLGLGWIRSADVLETTSRRPGRPPIQNLKIGLQLRAESSAALAAVAMVGSTLKSLDITACGDVNAATLGPLAHACPALTSLSVTHDGSLWSTSRSQVVPLLAELCLTLPGKEYRAPSRYALHASLRKLATLRVIATKPSFASNRRAITSLLGTHKSLQYLHWSDPEWRERVVDRHNGRFPYVDGCLYTAKQLGLAVRGREVVHLNSHAADARVAFLSAIVRGRHSSSAISRLDNDLVAQIFSFSTLKASRDIWVGA